MDVVTDAPQSVGPDSRGYHSGLPRADIANRKLVEKQGQACVRFSQKPDDCPGFNAYDQQA